MPARLDALHRGSSGYDEESIDSRSAPCDKRHDDIQESLEPDPFVRDSDSGEAPVDFPRFAVDIEMSGKLIHLHEVI